MKYQLFSAVWCGGCHSIKEFIREHNLPVEVINIDLDMKLAQEHNVRGIPALLVDGDCLITGQKEIMNILKEVQTK